MQQKDTTIPVSQLIMDLEKSLKFRNATSEDLSEEPVDWANTTHQQRKVIWYNQTPGTLTGCNCPICRNKGVVMYINDDGFEVVKECECMKNRITAGRAMMYIEKSGSKEDIKRMKFTNYKTDEPWQRSIKTDIINFVRDYDLETSAKWLFVGGQPGAGKTHLCTAACMKLIASGHDLRYENWRQIVFNLESKRFESSYEDYMSDILDAEILYIDDLLKQEDKKKIPAELTYAWEIIDGRSRRNKATIISTQWLISQLAEMDPALSGRINHISKIVQVDYQEGRDYRAR